MSDEIIVNLKEIAERINGTPVKHKGKIIGKVTGVSFYDACRHEGASVDLQVEITDESMQDKFWRVKFV